MMKKVLAAILFFTLVAIFFMAAAVSADDTVKVRVGIYENEPKVFTDSFGNPAGFWPDIMQYIAARESWEIEWVHGTWAECLERLKNNEIDIMVDMAHSSNRAETYLLSSEYVYTSWSLIYVQPGSDIQSLPDLKGKKLAVMKGSINVDGPEGIKLLASSFDIDITYIETTSYAEVFELIDNKEADAGVVSKDFANFHEASYKVKRTGIVFQPAHLHFAFCKDSPVATVLRARIDNDLGQLKADEKSIYYEAMAHWLGVQPVQTKVIPGWLIWTLLSVAFLAVILIGGVALFRFELNRKTRQLEEKVKEQLVTKREVNKLSIRQEVILSAVPDIIAEVDNNKVYTWVNQAGYQFFGDDVIGKEAAAYFEGRQNVYSQVSPIFLGDKNTIYLESWQRRRDGQKRLLGWWCRTITDENGKVKGALSTARDITEQKLAAEAIEKTHKELEAVFQSMTDAVFISDADARVININDAFATFHRFKNKEECIRVMDRLNDYVEVYFPDGNLTPWSMLAAVKALRGETGNGEEYQLRRKDTGETWWGSYSYNPIRDKENKIIGTVVVAHDITKRKNDQAVIIEAKNKLETVFESMTDAVFITDDKGKIIDFNNAFVKIHHFSSRDKSYRTLEEYLTYIEIIYPDGTIVTPDMWPVFRALRGETGRNAEYMIRQKNTHDVWWVEYSFSPVKDKENHILGSVVVANDITERKMKDKALRESEGKLREIIENVPEGIVVADIHGIITSVNPAVLRMHGFSSKEEIVGKQLFDLLVKDERDTARGRRKELMQAGIIKATQHLFLKQDGSAFPAEMSSAVMKDDAGVLQGFISITMDVSERWQIQRTLQENERKIREAQQIAHLGYWEWNVKTGDVQWSEEIFHIFDLDPATFQPKIDSILALSPWPEDHQRDQELISRAMASREAGQYEQKFLRPDNSIGYYLSNFQGTYNASGELEAINGTVLDITERKNAEDALRESERKLRLILETVPVGLVVTDTEGRIIQYNQAVVSIIGSAGDLTMSRYLDLFPSGINGPIQEGLSRDLGDGAGQIGEYTLRKVDGATVDVEIVTAMIKDSVNQPLGFVSVISDISARKLATEEHQKIVEFKELDRVKTNLLSTVSHELRTPLASIKGYASLLLMYDQKLTKAQKMESVDAIDRATDRLTELIDHLLDMSRLDAGVLKLTLAPINPRDIILAAVDEAKLRSPDYRFKKEIPAQIPDLMADGRRLRQVIDNILENAVKYSPLKTVITLKTQVLPDALQISISDQGRGIPEEEHQKIFERMYRIEQRLQKDPGGLGLGLSLCKALVESHHGRIWVQSAVGKGSTFYFTIPLVKVEGGKTTDEKKQTAVKESTRDR